MCFSVPVKVVKVSGNKAFIEGGRQIRLSGDMAVTKGEYLQVAGCMAVGKLSAEEGLKVRLLIKSLAGKDDI